MLQEPGDRVNRLVYHGHADQSLKQVKLVELALDRDGLVLIKGSRSMNTTLFWLALAIFLQVFFFSWQKKEKYEHKWEDIPLSYQMGRTNSCTILPQRDLGSSNFSSYV